MVRFVRTVLVVGLVGSLGLVLAPAHASTAHPGSALPYTVTASLSSSRVDLGGSALLTGSVSPGAPGHSVAIKALPPGATTWSTLKTVTLNSQSRYSTTVRPTRAGVTSYRVVRATIGAHAGGSSTAVKLTAWRWRSLGGMPAAPGLSSTATMAKVASVNLKGQFFTPALIETPGDSIDYGDQYYSLGGKCSKIDAWVGTTSDSVDDDQAAAWLLGDTLANPHSFTNLLVHDIVHRDGDPAHIVRTGSSVSTIGTLDVYIQSVNTGDKVAWASAILYCKF